MPYTALYVRVSAQDRDPTWQNFELKPEAGHDKWYGVQVCGEKISGTAEMLRDRYEHLIADAEGIKE